MKKTTLRHSTLALSLGLALIAMPSFAQNTSAALGGRISSAEGKPLANAEVVITHVESGSSTRASTDADGRYISRGLRVGGPYTITITKDGVTEKREGVYLELAQTSTLDAQLGDEAKTLAAVQVTGKAGSELFSNKAMGAGTSINRQQLEAFASIKRSLQDYARLDPRLAQTDKQRGEISALGQNSRFNSITVDGVTTNDTFGLEANNLPTEKQPISIDAIQSVQVNVTNYDVTQNQYTGANINAVTKSGTNDFKGTLTYVYRDKNAVGNGFNNAPFTFFNDEKTYGGTFGGPIIQDSLFFFLTYENFVRTSPGSDYGTADSNAANRLSNITTAELTALQNSAQSVWNISAGSLSSNALKNETEDLLAKIDWNINDRHRASFRYNETKQTQLQIRNTAPNSSFSLSSHWYVQEKSFDTLVGQLFSDWTDNFSTEFRLSKRNYDSAPNSNSRLPQVRVFDGTQSIFFGTEQFRHANKLTTETLNSYLAANWFLGDHQLKFGADYESNKVFNKFVESSLGAYEFSNYANFNAGIASNAVLRRSVTGNSNDAAARYTLDNLGLFVQDSWSVNDRLTVTGGIRADLASTSDTPPFNAAASTFFGLRNDTTIDGAKLIQPRVGFNYTFAGDTKRQLRGGLGLFQGASANVWLANPYTNNGLTIQVFGCGRGSLGTFSINCPVTPIFSANPDNQAGIIAAAGAAPRADIDFLSPDLEQPSLWKANLAFETELPFWGLVASVEAILTEVNRGIYYQHLNLGAPTRTGSDGRALYWNAAGYNAASFNANSGAVVTGSGAAARANANPLYNEVLLAAPTRKGSGKNLTFSISKPMSNQWSWALGYNYSESTEVSGLTSTRSIENWRTRAILNPNEEVESNSIYNTRDRFTGQLNWTKNFFEGYKTQFSVFYEGRSGKPYSWTFNNDANGDGAAGNDLLYIPRNPGDVIFRGGAAEEALFFNYISQFPELQFARGTTVARNSGDSPWVHTFDVRVSQEFPGFFDGNKAKVSLDLLNIGNMINRKWGLTDEILFLSNAPGGQARSFVNYQGIDPATGRYIYSLQRTATGAFNPEQTSVRDSAGESRWGAQLTVRYEF
jgi:Carboxypeptidase regulatory-like domain/TonB dependent receptor